jgi:long-chain acyl-CoA synthetase
MVHCFRCAWATIKLIELGALSQSMTVVTAYDTLGEEGLSHSLTQTKAKIIFADPMLFPRITKALESARDVRAIVYNEDAAPAVDPKHVEVIEGEYPGVSVYSFGEFLASATEDVSPVPPSADDLACIMYTSGSTGAPKGVLLKHKNIVAAIAGANATIEEHMVPGERLLAYLPLAHIIEFVFENAALYWGGVMGYGSPRTLTDQSVRKCLGDLRAFRPSIMVGVPAVWESVKKGIVKKVEASGRVKSKVFWSAMRAKESLLFWHLPGANVLDYLVFNQIKDATGGNLRLVMNGGGPIAENTARFISLAVCPMINGYGLTETCG